MTEEEEEEESLKVHRRVICIVIMTCVSLFRVAIQYAKAMGMRPIAIDLGLEKKEICISHGAELFVDCSPDNPVNIHESINEYTQGRSINRY